MISGNGKPFASPQDLLKRADAIRKERESIKQEIRVCAGPGCIARGAKDVIC